MRRKKFILNAILVFGVLLLVVSGILVWCCSSNHVTRHKLYVRTLLWGLRDFDSSDWKRFPGEDELHIEHRDVRGEMLFKLLWTNDLMEMTREEVTELLGPPEAAHGGYYIGNHTMFEIDPDLFYIDYDAAGRVRDFHTEQH